MLPCLIFEDEHLLVVNKPAGMNTHAPSPFAGEGIYEFLKHREPRWARLAIIHRLDKETSGVLVLSKTALGNKSLGQQFTDHTIRKTYHLLTDRRVNLASLPVVSTIVRVGDHYASRPFVPGGERAETHFRALPGEASVASYSSLKGQRLTLVRAEPVTGRTHQIRVHASESGFPVLGDVLYGGTPAARVCLHAAELTLRHPATGQEMTFTAPANFAADAREALREALIERDTGEQATNAYRLIHGAADGRAGWYVDRCGEFILSQSDRPLTGPQNAELSRQLSRLGARGVYHKILTRQAGRHNPPQASPQFVTGEAAPPAFTIRENGVAFELGFNEGYSVGLFLDQRENRRRFLANHVAAGFPLFPGGPGGAEVLNAFAYTCGFSVCAARAGARTTSLDLSKKYLDWGRRNFALNQLDPAAHDFIHGEVFEWLRRFVKQKRSFDAIVLDPPTFSQSKESGTFQAEKDFGGLVRAALPLLKPGGVLLASTNAARLSPEKFLEMTTGAINSAPRKLLRQHYVPQPPDFPINREEPAHLKTVWLQVQ